MFAWRVFFAIASTNFLLLSGSEFTCLPFESIILKLFSKVYQIEKLVSMLQAYGFLFEIVNFSVIRCYSRFTDLLMRVCVIQFVFQLFIFLSLFVLLIFFQVECFLLILSLKLCLFRYILSFVFV